MKLSKQTIVLVLFSVWVLSIAFGNTIVDALDLQYDESVAWRSVVYYLLVLMALPAAAYGAVLSHAFGGWDQPSILSFALAQATVLWLGWLTLRRVRRTR